VTPAAREFAFRSAAELARLVAAREVSPVELVEASIARIEERNPALNAFVFTDFDHAREAAKTAEQAVTSGAELGPLHGVPTAIKDLFDARPGWISTFGGVPSLASYRADWYCTWAERMEAAGAILLGKTNAPVLGFRAVCDNSLFGPSRNPFDETRNTGGSSGGSAAAVADGLVSFAEGTDAGGSVRIPAAWCNLVGYKPSAGRVPVVMRPNGFGAVTPFIHEGLLTRTVEDVVLGLRALTGYDPRDPFCLDERPDYRGALDGDLRGMRVAYSPNFDVHAVDPQIAEVVRRSVRLLEAAGASVDEVSVGIRRDQRELSELWCRMGARLTLPAVLAFREQGVDLLDGDDLPAPLRFWLDQVAAESPLAQVADAVVRTEIFDAIQGTLATYDLIVTPTVGALPVPNGERGQTLGPAEIDGVAVDPSIGWTLTYMINFTGHPSVSVPVGLIDGLPVGMQIVGRRYSDGDVLRASAAVEQHQPWAGWYPASPKPT
jgi:amidase/aspartyl-tRNA(Asn)/glutamyl-tRNA(Gln) amidotransferase subunit A